MRRCTCQSRLLGARNHHIAITAGRQFQIDRSPVNLAGETNPHDQFEALLLEISRWPPYSMSTNTFEQSNESISSDNAPNSFYPDDQTLESSEIMLSVS